MSSYLETDAEGNVIFEALDLAYCFGEAQI